MVINLQSDGAALQKPLAKAAPMRTDATRKERLINLMFPVDCARSLRQYRIGERIPPGGPLFSAHPRNSSI
jgi:hypothetical protein